MRNWLLVGALCGGICSPAAAWWDEGHMQVAALAYDQLTPTARAKADALIRLNPQYGNWVVGWPPGKAAQYAFVRASAWADDIKGPDLGFTDVGDSAGKSEAGRNIGYYDNLMHKYWHYKDIGFSTDGTAIEEGDPVNAVTQIKLLAQGLSPASGQPDEVRSYDLVWLLHLVGDAHQPLHATARFSHAHPHGDQGGNLAKVIPATGETITLHAYWDRLLGSYSTPQGAIMDAMVDKNTKLPKPDPERAGELDPEVWFKESEKLAEDVAYAEPVRSCTEACTLDRPYETKARETARVQAALAAARLANLINAALK
ncbi:S1/P1 nuclease [Xanthobacter sp. V3C-4]|uniref:S1/P1 nuclease n=2 Tax=Xanthobacter TaxID=279 RepID=UPI00372AD5E2